MKPTNSVSTVSLKIDLQATNSKVELWTFDLPGEESFLALNRMYLRDANVALVVYDVSKKDSLDQAKVWIDELKNTCPSELLVVLCGNKMDTA